MIPIIQRVPWASQPPPGAAIDWSNPICRGLISVQDARGFDAITGQGILYNTASISKVPLPLGLGANFNQNQIDYPLSSDSSYNNASASLLLIGFPQSGTWNVACVNHGLSIRRYTSNLCVTYNGYQYFFNFAPWTGLSIIVVTIDSTQSAASQCKVWVDGKPLTYSSYTTNAWAIQNNTLGGSRTGDRSAATWWAKPLLASCRWNRTLSDLEAMSLYPSPWQIFAP